MHAIQDLELSSLHSRLTLRFAQSGRAVKMSAFNLYCTKLLLTNHSISFQVCYINVDSLDKLVSSRSHKDNLDLASKVREVLIQRFPFHLLYYTTES